MAAIDYSGTSLLTLAFPLRRRLWKNWQEITATPKIIIIATRTRICKGKAKLSSRTSQGERDSSHLPFEQHAWLPQSSLEEHLTPAQLAWQVTLSSTPQQCSKHSFKVEKCQHLLESTNVTLEIKTKLTNDSIITGSPLSKTRRHKLENLRFDSFESKLLRTQRVQRSGRTCNTFESGWRTFYFNCLLTHMSTMRITNKYIWG